MGITDKMYSLASAARRLNDGSDHLNRLISDIDKLLGKLMIGMDYIHTRPVAESVSYDKEGHRVIEVSYVAYLKVNSGWHLAIKTVKVLEAKKQLANEAPGSVLPLLEAPRRLRYAAVELLPDVVSGLANQVDEVLNKMERRCEVAETLLDHLEGMLDVEPRPSDPAMAEKFESLAEASGVYEGGGVRHGAQPRRKRRKTSPRM
jgi:bifunctional DNase/RNase